MPATVLLTLTHDEALLLWHALGDYSIATLNRTHAKMVARGIHIEDISLDLDIIRESREKRVAAGRLGERLQDLLGIEPEEEGETLAGGSSPLRDDGAST